MEKKIIYDLDFNADIDMEGVYNITVVKDPAIKSNFVTLSKQTDELMLSAVDDEKRLLVGPVLIPDQEVLRKNGTYIRFSKKVIRKCMEAFFKRDYHKNSKLEHGSKDKLSGMCVVESWIIEDANNDKANFYGLDLPVGTWVVSMRADNDEVYQLAKEKKIIGFSIEGMFKDRTLATDNPNDMTDKINDMSDEDIEVLSGICDEAIKGAESKEEAVEFIKSILKKL